MEESQIHSVSKTLLQICITVLPIGAGASSFISQQEHTPSVFIALGLVWAGLLTISYCSYILIRVLQFEGGSPGKVDENKARFNNSIRLFILGTLFLVLSPIGFAINQMMPPTHPIIELYRQTLAVNKQEDKSKNQEVVLTISKLDTSEIPKSLIHVVSLNQQCISASKTNEILPWGENGAWITSWQISTQYTCPFGDQLIQFVVLNNGESIAQTNLIVNVTP